MKTQFTEDDFVAGWEEFSLLDLWAVGIVNTSEGACVVAIVRDEKGKIVVYTQRDCTAIQAQTQRWNELTDNRKARSTWLIEIGMAAFQMAQ